MQIARILQFNVLALLLGAALWFLAWRWQGREGLALAGALAIPWIHVPALFVETLLVALINRRDPAPPATWYQRLRALVVEAGLTPIVFYLRQAFFHDAIADGSRLQEGVLPRRGVVLVHGFYCNRAFWNPWMRRLQAEGIPFVAVDLDPPFDSIDRYAAPIEAAVRRLEQDTGLAPVVVGHSMGGLALRAWLRAHQGDDRIQRAITIGTPHRGTWITRLAFSPAKQQMSLDSEWLRRLVREEPPSRYMSFTCFWSHCDNVVFPASTATLPHADNRHVAGAAHVELVCREEVFEEVLRWLGPPAKSSARF